MNCNKKSNNNALRLAARPRGDYNGGSNAALLAAYQGDVIALARARRRGAAARADMQRMLAPGYGPAKHDCGCGGGCGGCGQRKGGRQTTASPELVLATAMAADAERARLRVARHDDHVLPPTEARVIAEPRACPLPDRRVFEPVSRVAFDTWTSTCGARATQLDVELASTARTCATRSDVHFAVAALPLAGFTHGFLFAGAEDFPAHGFNITWSVGRDEPFAGGEILVVVSGIGKHVDPVNATRAGAWQVRPHTGTIVLPPIGGETNTYVAPGLVKPALNPVPTRIDIAAVGFPAGTLIAVDTLTGDEYDALWGAR